MHKTHTTHKTSKTHAKQHPKCMHDVCACSPLGDVIDKAFSALDTGNGTGAGEGAEEGRRVERGVKLLSRMIQQVWGMCARA